jgi:preprotein translocase subunit YajC
MFDSLPLTLAQATAPSIDELRPSPPPAADGTATHTDGTTTTTTSQGVATSQPSQSQPNSPLSYLPLVLMAVVVFFLFFRGPQKEKKKREALLSSIKKGDKIQTIGGVIGTVVEMRDNEILIESASTRIKFTRGAIQSVLEEKTE